MEQNRHRENITEVSEARASVGDTHSWLGAFGESARTQFLPTMCSICVPCSGLCLWIQVFLVAQNILVLLRFSSDWEMGAPWIISTVIMDKYLLDWSGQEPLRDV